MIRKDKNFFFSPGAARRIKKKYRLTEKNFGKKEMREPSPQPI